MKLSASGQEIGGDMLFKRRVGSEDCARTHTRRHTKNNHDLKKKKKKRNNNNRPVTPKRKRYCFSTRFSGTPSSLLPLEMGQTQFEKGADGLMLSVMNNPDHVDYRFAFECLLGGLHILYDKNKKVNQR